MLVVNLFGGPGTGKSTTATRLFSELKTRGVNAEYVPEFAKGAAWEKRSSKFFMAQQYIYGTQSWWMDRLRGEVDVIVTDAPLLNNIAYYDESLNLPSLRKVIIEDHNRYNNMNVFLKRSKAYNPKGRNQTEEEARLYDQKIKGIIKELNIPFKEYDTDDSGFYSLALDTFIALKQSKGAI